MPQTRTKVGLAVLILGVPIMLAELVANLQAPSSIVGESSGRPLQVLPVGSTAFLQGVANTAYNPYVVTALGAILVLAGVYLAWRGRKRDLPFKAGSPVALLLALGFILLALAGVYMLPKSSSPTGLTPPPSVGQWISSASGYASSASGSTVAFVLLGTAIAGVLLFASVQSSRRVLSKTPATPKASAQAILEPAHTRVMRDDGLGADFRSTVLRSYRDISGALQEQMKVDVSGLTAREVETMAGEVVTTSKAFLHEATILFEKAKYSLYPISEENAKRSLVCLENIAPEAVRTGPIARKVRA